MRCARITCLLLAGIALLPCRLANAQSIGMPSIPTRDENDVKNHSDTPVGNTPHRLGNSASEELSNKAHQSELASFNQLPMRFEVNEGQSDSQVKFLSRAGGYTLYLTQTADAVLAVQAPSASRSMDRHDFESKPTDAANVSVLRMSLRGANLEPQVEGLDELPGKSNYFIGKDPARWRRGVTAYRRIAYRSIYSGVDLLYRGNNGGQLENDFVVAPGTNPQLIRFSFVGAKRLHLEPSGDLVLDLDRSQLRLCKPVAYQEEQGKRQAVEARYVLKSKHEVGFRLSHYDASKPLTIDPVLSYLTYLGGNSQDSGNGIAVDSSGNVYVTGFTFSTNFPPTPSAFDTTCGTDGNCNFQASDAFVAKLNPSKSGAASLVYSTYLGGSGSEDALGIAVDGTGDAYVTGSGNLNNDFPTTPGAFVTTCANVGFGNCTGFFDLMEFLYHGE